MSVTPEFFRIDQDRLDEEWVGQAPTYYEYSVKLVDAREEHERAKSREDVVEAELDKEIRRDPASFGITKITEEVVKKTITLQRRYQKAHEEVIQTRHDMGIHQAAVDALEHKKKGLESMVYLHSQGYNSEPRAPKGGGREVGQMKADAAFGKRKPHIARED